MIGELSFEVVPLFQVPQEKPSTEESHPRPVVLVVDDVQVIADTRVAILASWGYTAIACYDAESAIETARIIPPEILIADVLLIRMNGVDLAAAVQLIASDCEVLLFSGSAEAHDLLAAARRAGHNFTLLQKPVHPLEMHARIREFAGFSKANRLSFIV